MPRRSTVTTALVIATALVLSAVAFAATRTISQTAQSGAVKATFSFTVKTPRKALPAYSNEKLTIVRTGQTYVNPLKGAHCPLCVPSDPTPKGHSVQVVDINQTGEPNAVVTLYSGGAHCCTVAELFSYSSSTNAYVETDHNFADPGFKLKQLTPGGAYRFVSADARFEYEFTDFADSGVPIQIWAFQNGAFTDVTRSYPALIAKDAARWLKGFNSAKKNVGGLLAAWAADEELLGKDALVQSTLQTALKAGHLGGNLVANGKKYVTLLNRFLKKTGYTHA